MISFCSFLANAAFSEDDEWIPVNPFSGDEEIIAKGRSLFNIHCSWSNFLNNVASHLNEFLRTSTQQYIIEPL